jgi:hypothetical protein
MYFYLLMHSKQKIITLVYLIFRTNTATASQLIHSKAITNLEMSPETIRIA